MSITNELHGHNQGRETMWLCLRHFQVDGPSRQGDYERLRTDSRFGEGGGSGNDFRPRDETVWRQGVYLPRPGGSYLEHWEYDPWEDTVH